MFIRDGTPSGLSTISAGRTTIRHVRHIFNRADLENHTIAVTTGHLVTRLQATTLSNIDLDHLQDTRGQFVTTGSFVVLDLIFARIIFTGMLDSLLVDAVLRDFFFGDRRGRTPAPRPKIQA